MSVSISHSSAPTSKWLDCPLCLTFCVVSEYQTSNIFCTKGGWYLRPAVLYTKVPHWFVLVFIYFSFSLTKEHQHNGEHTIVDQQDGLEVIYIYRSKQSIMHALSHCPICAIHNHSRS